MIARNAQALRHRVRLGLNPLVSPFLLAEEIKLVPHDKHHARVETLGFHPAERCDVTFFADLLAREYNDNRSRLIDTLPCRRCSIPILADTGSVLQLHTILQQWQRGFYYCVCVCVAF